MRKIKAAIVEKDVENIYRAALTRARPTATVGSPHGTDGFMCWGAVRMLVEFKFDLDLTSRAEVCRVLGQCVLYLRRFADAGEPLPNVIFVGDKNECFVLPVASLSGFLDLPIDWTVAPSTGSPELVAALVSGLNLLPYVYRVTAKFKITAVLERAEQLDGDATPTRATLANVGTIFTHWRSRVFKSGKSQTLTPVEQVDVFLRCLFEPSDVYLHPKKKGLLVVPGYANGVAVKADQYRAFFDHFVQGYRASEVEAFYAAKDRLIDDDARRRQGAFFTPAIWVDEAHKTITEVLGPNWRDECIVWDPAAGTGNLTRDYDFADLIITTAELSDVETIRSQRYNYPGAAIAQYDFLNPDAPSPFLNGEINRLPVEIDQRLRAAAAAGKRLVFLMNPPYGTASNSGVNTSVAVKAGLAITAVNSAMKLRKLGASSQQLYAQFMYQSDALARVYGFAARTVALFTNVTFMTGVSFTKFRTAWYARSHYLGGFMFRADHFADVSADWAIAFTVWDTGTCDGPVALRLKSLDSFTVVTSPEKQLHTPGDLAASKWVRPPKGSSCIRQQAPIAKSGLVIRAGGEGRCGQWGPTALGTFCSDSNNVTKSGVCCYLLSTQASTASGPLVMLPGNFRRCMALFAARKLVASTWINHKDEYFAPDETRPGYAQWVDDAHVYSLLHPFNNCTAMRDVDYADRKWQISNHFFWRKRAAALDALDSTLTRDLYRDGLDHPAGYVVPPAEGTPREPWEIAGDPYLAHVLPSLELSPEAQRVLDLLDELWLASLRERESFAAGRPELHLLAWDGGAYQLKHLWREHFPAAWEQLRDAQRALADRLRPGVYDFGFLLA